MDQSTAKLVIAGVFVGAGLLELVRGRFGLKETPSARNLVLDGVSALVLPLAIVPTILLLAPLLAESSLPGHESWLGNLPWWAMFGVLLLADDLTQYMWHRLSHTRWLYPLHRAHHSAEYMSISIVYRNNLVYYMLIEPPRVSRSPLKLGDWGHGEEEVHAGSSRARRPARSGEREGARLEVGRHQLCRFEDRLQRRDAAEVGAPG